MAVRVDWGGFTEKDNLDIPRVVGAPSTAREKAEMSPKKPSDFVHELWRASGLSYPGLPVLLPFLRGSCCCSDCF